MWWLKLESPRTPMVGVEKKRETSCLIEFPLELLILKWLLDKKNYLQWSVLGKKAKHSALSYLKMWLNHMGSSKHNLSIKSIGSGNWFFVRKFYQSNFHVI